MAEYVEREALIAKLQAHKNIFVKAWGSFRKMPEKDRAMVDAITTCISDVMNATAADVVEVKRGRWIVFVEDDSPWDSLWKCSCCGAYGTTEEPVHKNFCPNCGADMREGDHAV